MWTPKDKKAYFPMVTQDPILALPKFTNLFRVKYDAFGVGISEGLSQISKHCLYISLINH